MFCVFLVGCVEEISDVELGEELETLSETELEKLTYEGNVEESKAIAGQASKWDKKIEIKKKSVRMSRASTKAKELYIKKQKEFIAGITDKSEEKRLTYSLNYKLKSGERFDRWGNIMVKLDDGKEIALLGYPAEKKDFLLSEKTKTPVWEELAELKKEIASKEPKKQYLDIKTDIKKIKSDNSRERIKNVLSDEERDELTLDVPSEEKEKKALVGQAIMCRLGDCGGDTTCRYAVMGNPVGSGIYAWNRNSNKRCRPKENNHWPCNIDSQC